MRTNIDGKHYNAAGKEVVCLSVWCEVADLTALTREAGRRATAGGRPVPRAEVVREAIKRAADEVRESLERP